MAETQTREWVHESFDLDGLPMQVSSNGVTFVSGHDTGYFVLSMKALPQYLAAIRAVAPEQWEAAVEQWADEVGKVVEYPHWHE